MDKLRDALEVLRDLKRKHGNILSLNLVFESLLGEGIYNSRDAVANCLRKLQVIGKIRLVHVGVDIELLEDVKIEHIQSSLIDVMKR